MLLNSYGSLRVPIVCCYICVFLWKLQGSLLISVSIEKHASSIESKKGDFYLLAQVCCTYTNYYTNFDFKHLCMYDQNDNSMGLFCHYYS